MEHRSYCGHGLLIVHTSYIHRTSRVDRVNGASRVDRVNGALTNLTVGLGIPVGLIQFTSYLSPAANTTGPCTFGSRLYGVNLDSSKITHIKTHYVKHIMRLDILALVYIRWRQRPNGGSKAATVLLHYRTVMVKQVQVINSYNKVPSSGILFYSNVKRDYIFAIYTYMCTDTSKCSSTKKFLNFGCKYMWYAVVNHYFSYTERLKVLDLTRAYDFMNNLSINPFKKLTDPLTFNI